MNLSGIFGAAIAVFLMQQPQASVEGVVIRAGTSDPVAKAVVELKTSAGARSSTMVTGGDGKFEFRNLSPGSYQITVSRAGYLDSAYGQRGPNGRGRPLAIGAGQPVKDVRLTMIPTGAISGRVYDNTGEPLANISVRAFKYSYAAGERKATTVTTAETNDRGEYRLFWLPPGLYYISAMPQSVQFRDLVMASGGRHEPGPTSAAEKLGETYLPTYYPNTSDPQSATPVELHPGMDFSGIDLTLDRVTPHKIRGNVLDSRGQAATPVSNDPNRYARASNVTLVPRGAAINGTRFTGASVFDGSFEIADVLPGAYFLVATRPMNTGRADGSSLVGALVPLDVRGSDVDRLSIILPPVISITGQVAVDGVLENAGDAILPHVTLKNTLLGIPNPIQRAEGSQLLIDGLIEGDYQVQVTRLPAGTYVKAVRFGAADVLNGGLHIDSQTNNRLDIVLGTNPGTLDGTVVDKNREPVANAAVALAPDAAHRQRADLYLNALTDESGHFRLQDIPPGDYILLAWEDIEEGQWRDPEFIRRNEGPAKIIHVLNGSRETVEVTALPFSF